MSMPDLDCMLEKEQDDTGRWTQSLRGHDWMVWKVKSTRVAFYTGCPFNRERTRCTAQY